jgi:hypothetical protein
MRMFLRFAAVALVALFTSNVHAAKTCTRLTEGNFTSGGTTNDTDSISPAASSGIAVGIYAYNTATMSVSGAGLTWTTAVNGEVVGDGGRMWVFTAAGASPSSGVLTLTYDNDAFVNWVVDNITGTINLSTPSNANVVDNTGTSAAPSATLGAFGHASNGVWAYGYLQESTTVTQGSGYTLVDSNIGSAMFGHTDFSQCIDSNDTSVDATLADSSIWSFVAIEIVDSASGGASGLLLRRRRAANDDHFDPQERLAAGF